MTAEDEDIQTLQDYTGWDVEKCKKFLQSRISTQKFQVDARLLQELLPKLTQVGLLQSGAVELTVSVPYGDLDDFYALLRKLAKDNGRNFLEGPGNSTDSKLN